MRLWRRHRRWVAAVAYAHKPRDVDLEDLLQEVAMKLVRNIHRINDPSAIRPWLRTVTVNAARSAGRRTAARARHETTVDVEHAEKLADRPLGPEVGGAVESSRSRGRRALELASGLPPHYREPLLLSLRGLSQKQIAAVLDVPVTTVETRLIRARRMLKEELEAEERPGAPRNAAPSGPPLGNPVS